ncbi:MAG: autoinducer binding domain-containing protein [Hyphomonadaceae bacterium]|nr:autoinducer binding domain-containing protein [Hyphomonadaceae bacterium]
MSSKYWAFVEACDQTQTARSVKDLLDLTFRDLGVSGFAIATHGRIEDQRSLGVLVHSWPTPAIDWLFAYERGASFNPMFAAVEQSSGPLYWPPVHSRRDQRKKPQKQWFDQLRELVGQREGVSQALRSVIVGASCSLTSSERLDPDRIRLCMRIGNYAYQQVLELQKPKLSDAEQLTAREHEFLYRATVFGERPADVASQLDVKISTVRTLRQKASVRLDAGSQEQAAWRMLETGQLFRAGRRTRPRGR